MGLKWVPANHYERRAARLICPILAKECLGGRCAWWAGQCAVPAAVLAFLSNQEEEEQAEVRG